MCVVFVVLCVLYTVCGVCFVVCCVWWLWVRCGGVMCVGVQASGVGFGGCLVCQQIRRYHSNGWIPACLGKWVAQ